MRDRNDELKGIEYSNPDVVHREEKMLDFKLQCLQSFQN